MKLTQTIAAAVIIASGSTAMAGAVVELGPSQITGTLTGLDNLQFPEIRGVSLDDSFYDFAIHSETAGEGAAALYEGTLMTRVVRSHQTGLLTFNYVLLDPNASLNGEVANVEVTGFEGWEARVEYRNDASAPHQGDEGPSGASRDSTGDIIDFSFGQSLQTNEESEFFFVMLNTTEYYEDTGLVTITLQGGESVSFSIMGANPAVPTPGALGLLSAAGLFSVRRRR